MSTTSTAPKSLWRRVEHLGAGRYRVHVERGALEHADQLNLKSELQRKRYAQACDAKEPGCYDEVLRMLEREALLEGSKYNADHDDGCRFVFTTADKLVLEPVDWLWEKYIPAGAVTILEGDPGVGKSLLLCDLAARVSRGFLAPDRNPAFDEPGHDPEPCPELVWWFSGQDHAERTLAPRLAAAGADLSMIKVIEGTEDLKSNKCRPVAFPDDFHSLWKGRGQSPRLVVVDPLSSFCGGAHNHQAAHKAIAELVRFASATGAAVLVVRPLNRRLGASASERGSAGPTLTAEARSALLLARHPDDPVRAVLAVVKSNLSARAPSLELRIEDQPRPGRLASPDSLASPERQRRESPHQPTNTPVEALDSPPNTKHQTLSTPRISWLGPSPLLADDLVRVRATIATPRSPFETRQVERWLSENLSSGPRLASDITSQAELDSVPPVLLRRARISLNIIPTGRNGSTTWTLPKNPPPLAGEGGELASRVGATFHESKPTETSSTEPPSPLVEEGLGVRGNEKPEDACMSLSTDQPPAAVKHLPTTCDPIGPITG